LDPALSAIASTLDGIGAPRPDANLHVWRIDYGPLWKFFSESGVERTKAAVLEAAWQLPAPLFFAPENPIDDDLKPFVRSEGSAWRIDKTRSAAAFYAIEPASGIGNWQLYAADQPVEALPDAHRTSPADLILFMTANRITLLIDALHDDTDWCVAICDQQSAQGTESSDSFRTSPLA